MKAKRAGRLSLMLSVLAMTALIIGAGSAYAEISGDYEYEVIDDQRAVITDYTGTESEISVPETLDQYLIVGIGQEAFAWTRSLTTVKIPNSITTIGEEAFMNCENLQSINLTNHITNIGDGAFHGCEKLKSIVIPDSITTIAASTFALSGLESITLPNTITSIGEYAFEGCENLTGITLPDGLEEIGWDAFSSSGLKSIVVPDSVTNIGGSAFSMCENLKEVTLSKSLEVLEESMFSEDKSLTSVLIPSDSIGIIETQAFRGCSSLEYITLPSSVDMMDYAVFENCTSLKNFFLPDLTVVPMDTFRGCTSLKEVNIPVSVKRLETGVFYECTSLTDVWYDGSDLQWSKIVNEGYNDGLKHATIHYAKERSLNTLKVTSKTATVKYSKLKKAKQTIKVGKVLYVRKAQGTVSYKLVSVTKSKYKKYFSIAKKTGNVTVKKGLKKGTYKVKVKVTAAGNTEYKPKSITKTFKVVVK